MFRVSNLIKQISERKNKKERELYKNIDENKGESR